jgi:hypothetical protein
LGYYPGHEKGIRGQDSGCLSGGRVCGVCPSVLFFGQYEHQVLEVEHNLLIVYNESPLIVGGAKQF